MRKNEQVAPEPGKFRAYNQVVFLYGLEQVAKLALVIVLCAADCLFNPSVNREVLPFAERVDFKTLVFHRLPVRGHSNIAVSHAESIA